MRRRGGGEEARRHCQDEPRHRILEESAVGEGMDEERQERSTRVSPRARCFRRTCSIVHAAPASVAAYSRSPTKPSSAATVKGVVWEMKALLPAARGEPAARRGLAADPCAEDRPVRDRACRVLDPRRATARDATGRFVPCIRCHRDGGPRHGRPAQRRNGQRDPRSARHGHDQQGQHGDEEGGHARLRVREQEPRRFQGTTRAPMRTSSFFSRIAVTRMISPSTRWRPRCSDPGRGRRPGGTP